MKKIFILIYLITLCLSYSYAQDADAIVKNFINNSGLDNHKGESLRIELSMDSQGAIVPIIVSFSSDRKKVRIDMTVQQSEASMIITETEGWIESAGQVQPLPAEFISQTKNLTFLASFSDFLSACKFSSLGSDDTYNIIEAKISSIIYNIYFNKSNGLIDKVVTNGNSKNTIYFSDYKKYSDVLMPSRISAEASSQAPTNFIISKIQFSLTYPENYFSK